MDKSLSNHAEFQLELLGCPKVDRIVAFDGVTISFQCSAPILDGDYSTYFNYGPELENTWSGHTRVSKLGDIYQARLLISVGDSESALMWSEIPSALSVFDGGYEALDVERGSKAIGDLIEYSEVVRCRIHYQVGEAQASEDAKFTKQEGLKQISEIAIEVPPECALVPGGQVIVLELELFEASYFLVTMLADREREVLVLSLSQHIYKQRKRVAKRVPIPRDQWVDLPGIGTLIEISDFGLKVRSTSLVSFAPEQLLSADILGQTLTFRVVYVSAISPDSKYVGLHLVDYSSHARNVWQRFLIRFQYPLLKLRESNDHAKIWELLEESGYLDGHDGGQMRANKDAILADWSLVDDVGPDLGMTSVGYSGDRAVATIGVNRLDKNVWIAQAAAMISEPKFLPFTRSVYSWRTRAILNQPDGHFHFALFDSQKKFLHRFFRKSFLTIKHNDEIKWEDWNCGYVKQQSTKLAAGLPNICKNDGLDGRICTVFQSHEVTGMVVGGGISYRLTLGRQFQHMAQVARSAWVISKELAQTELDGLFDNVLHQASVCFIDSPGNTAAYQALINSGRIDPYLPTTAWLCPRKYLPEFLSLSLQSLEDMSRKYGKCAA